MHGHLFPRQAHEDGHQLQSLGRDQSDEGQVQQQDTPVGEEFYRHGQAAFLARREVARLDVPAGVQGRVLDRPVASCTEALRSAVVHSSVGSLDVSYLSYFYLSLISISLSFLSCLSLALYTTI